jgi:hypothetical protein
MISRETRGKSVFRDLWFISLPILSTASKIQMRYMLSKDITRWRRPFVHSHKLASILEK